MQLARPSCELGMSQDEFAEDIEVGKKSLAAWELDTNTPRAIVTIARRIEINYGVRATWMLGLENEKAPGDGPGVQWRAREDSNPQPSDP